MNASPATELSIAMLSWINDELRQTVEQRVDTEQRSRASARFATLVVAGISCVSLAAVRLFAL